MSDDLYDRAKRRYDELKAEMKDLEEYLRAHDRVAQRLKAESITVAPGLVKAGTGRADAGDNAPASSGDKSDQDRVRSPGRALIARKARDLLVAHGEPMTRGELVKAFENAGITIGGEDQSRNMGTIMWRLKDRFINIEGYGYWPSDVPCEKANYKPPVENFLLSYVMPPETTQEVDNKSKENG